MPRPTPARLRATVCVAPAMLLLLLAALVHPAPAQAAALPSKSAVGRRHLRTRCTARAPTSAAAPTRAARRLAVNLDIDNTSLASHYDYGAAGRGDAAVRPLRPRPRRDAAVQHRPDRGDGRLAKRHGPAAARRATAVTEICGRTSTHETLTHSKQRCRRHFVAEGWTLVANVGNRHTDFTGGSYERAFRLPSYGGRLA